MTRLIFCLVVISFLACSSQKPETVVPDNYDLRKRSRRIEEPGMEEQFNKALQGAVTGYKTDKDKEENPYDYYPYTDLGE